MPVCTQCGGGDFIEDCGHFYCQICHVQSQDMRVEEIEFEDVHNVQLTRTPAPVSQSVEEKDEGENLTRLGRPWTIQEGYQCVLKKQVEALIELGADPKLDEVVFRLWAAYLSALEVAFCDKEKLIPPRVDLDARARETSLGTIKRPTVSKPQNRYNSKAASKRQIEELEITREFENEEFDEEDEPVLFTEFTRPQTKSDPTTLLSPRNNVKYCVEWMTLSETLSFIYLGLLFTSNHITPSDIIRLAETDGIPYKSAITCLNSDMKISSYDVFLFSSALVPTTKDLRIMTSHLVRFLGIYELPPFPIEMITSNMLLKLDLPGELNGVVMNLMNYCQPDNSINVDITIKNIELVVACYIIITLKLYFGINDSREHSLTECARQLAKICPDENWFVWEEWQSHISSKYRIKQQVVGEHDFNEKLEEMTDIDKFIEFYKSAHHHKNKGLARTKENKAGIAEIKNTIEDMAKSAKISQAMNVCESMETEDSFDLLTDDIDDESSSIERRGSRLRSSSIRYLKSQRVVSGDHFKSSNNSMNASPQKSAVSTDTEELFEDSPPNQSKTDNRYKLTSHFNTDNLNSDQCKELTQILDRIHEDSGTYSKVIPQKPVTSKKSSLKSKLNRERHLTYEWLLSVFCKLIKCRLDELEFTLSNFEYCILGNDSKQKSKDLFFRHKYLKVKKKDGNISSELHENYDTESITSEQTNPLIWFE